MTKRALEMSRRRERILEAARELIARDGYENLTMRSLAQASGVTVPTIYNLIGNKEAVLGATIHEGTIRFWEGVQVGEDPLPILDRIITELLNQPAYYRPVLRILLNGGASSEMAELDGLFLKHVQDTVAGMSERGELEPWVDSAILGERLLSNLYGSTSEWVTGRLSDEALPVAASYDANLTLASVTTGERRKTFLENAARAQKGPIESERRRFRERRQASRDGS